MNQMKTFGGKGGQKVTNRNAIVGSMEDRTSDDEEAVPLPDPQPLRAHRGHGRTRYARASDRLYADDEEDIRGELNIVDYACKSPRVQPLDKRKKGLYKTWEQTRERLK